MIYMNNAATSYPKPDCVMSAMAEALSHEPGDGYRGGSRERDTFMSLRQELGELLGVSSPNQIALGPNATWGLNLGIFGLSLKPGDRIVATKAEHNSVLRPLSVLNRRGIEFILLDTDAFGRMEPAIWEAAMKRYRPRLAVFTHASNVTGAVNDAEILAAIAKNYGAYVLMDAAQTLGCIPVNGDAWKLDMIAFTGHKYLLGPQGTGGLWVRPGLTLQPLLVGGTGIQSNLDTMPDAMPLHLEAGTGNEPSCSGLLAAIRWQKENPMDYAAVMERTERLCLGLSKLGAHVIIPKGIRTPVVSFVLSEISPEETGFLLKESCDIVCRTGIHCAPKIFTSLGVPQTVRLSLSRFTTDEEIEEVLQAVEAILG